MSTGPQSTLAFVFAPCCPACKRKMRLRTIAREQSEETRQYRCDCGTVASQVLSRSELLTPNTGAQVL